MVSATSHNTYIIKAAPNVAKPASSYWHGFTTTGLERLRAEHGNNFYLLIEGAKNSDTDFFLIPFELVAMYYQPRKDWKGTVKPKADRWILVVRGGQDFTLDITACRNAGPRPYR